MKGPKPIDYIIIDPFGAGGVEGSAHSETTPIGSIVFLGDMFVVIQRCLVLDNYEPF